MASEDFNKIFLSIGLIENTIQNVMKNENNTKNLMDCIREANVTNGCNEKIGKLILEVATNKVMDRPKNKTHRPLLLKYIVSEQISNVVQVTAATEYINTHETIDENEFKKSSGVGVVITKEQMEKTIDETIAKHKANIAQNGKGALGKILHEIKAKLQFADGQLLNEVFKPKFEDVLNAEYDPSKASQPKKNGGEDNKHKNMTIMV